MAVTVKRVVAPMPAIVVEILVKVGDSVEAGQQLMTLECMKVQSPLVSSSQGVVRAINARLGDFVDSGMALLELALDQVVVGER